MYHYLSGGMSIVHPLQRSTLFTTTGTSDSFRRQIAKDDIREPCPKRQDEGATRSRVGALYVRQGSS